MVVRITFPRRDKGDQTTVLELDDARREVEEATQRGYIASYKGKQVFAKDVQDGQDINLTPTGMGG